MATSGIILRITLFLIVGGLLIGGQWYVKKFAESAEGRDERGQYFMYKYYSFSYKLYQFLFVIGMLCLFFVNDPCVIATYLMSIFLLVSTVSPLYLYLKCKGQYEHSERSVEEHMEWCIERALKYYDAGDPDQAFVSFFVDVGEHPATCHIGDNNIDRDLVMRGTHKSREEFEKILRGFLS